MDTYRCVECDRVTVGFGTHVSNVLCRSCYKGKMTAAGFPPTEEFLDLVFSGDVKDNDDKVSPERKERSR